jgi:hypothetical protein
MSNVEFVIIDPNKPPAEVIPHPAWGRRIADDVQHQLYGATQRRKITKDAITKHRKQLEQLGVAKHHIERDVAALEQQLFNNSRKRRIA